MLERGVEIPCEILPLVFHLVDFLPEREKAAAMFTHYAEGMIPHLRQTFAAKCGDWKSALLPGGSAIQRLVRQRPPVDCAFAFVKNANMPTTVTLVETNDRISSVVGGHGGAAAFKRETVRQSRDIALPYRSRR